MADKHINDELKDTKIVKLSDIISDENIFDGDWLLSENIETMPSDYKIIQLGNIGTGEFRAEKFKYISQATFDELNCKKVDSGCLLFNRMLDNGKFNCCVLDSHDDYVTSVDVMVIKPNDSVDLVYLKNALLSYKIQKQLVQLSSGSGRVRITKTNILNKVNFEMHETEMQKKIGKFLSLIDDLIETSKKLLEENDKLITACYQQIIKNEKTWKVYKIGDIFQVTRGSVLSKDKLNLEGAKYPVYSSQTTNNGLLGYFPEYLYENAITWTTDGANAGDVNYRHGKFYCTNVCGVLLSDEYANTFNAFHLNKKTRNYVSYVGNPKLMNNVMENISISFPTTNESNQYSILLDDLNHLNNLYKNNIESYVTLKKYYLNIIFK